MTSFFLAIKNQFLTLYSGKGKTFRHNLRISVPYEHIYSPSLLDLPEHDVGGIKTTLEKNPQNY
jgi:hypothetical protein